MLSGVSLINVALRFLPSIVVCLLVLAMNPVAVLGQCGPAELIKLASSEAEHFGTAVACSEDSVVIGAPLENQENMTSAGAAYIFMRIGGEWTEQAKLTAPDAAAGDRFGWAVAQTKEDGG